MHPRRRFDPLAPRLALGEGSSWLPDVEAGDAIQVHLWTLTCHVCVHRGPPDLHPDAIVCEACGAVFGHRALDRFAPGWQFRGRVPMPTQTQTAYLVELNMITDARAKAHQNVARRLEQLRETQSPRHWGRGRVSRIQRGTSESPAQKR
jgi:hypothetical protein